MNISNRSFQPDIQKYGLDYAHPRLRSLQSYEFLPKKSPPHTPGHAHTLLEPARRDFPKSRCNLGRLNHHEQFALVDSQLSKKKSPEELDNAAQSDSGIEIIQIEGNSEVKIELIDEEDVFVEEDPNDEDSIPTGSVEVRVRNLF